jgi:hypothetical protein
LLPSLRSGALSHEQSQLVAGPENRTPIVQNGNALKEANRTLRVGDEQNIADEMRPIDAIGRRYAKRHRFATRRLYLIGSMSSD